MTQLREKQYIFCFVILDQDADVRDQRTADESINMLKKYPDFSITSSFEVLETKMWKVNWIYMHTLLDRDNISE